jgi:3-(3-hydroxy-phenyl)propionate hydroxylase
MIDLSTTLGRILSPTNRLMAGARDVFLHAVVRAPVVRDWVLQMRFKPMPQYTDGVVVPDGHGPRSPVGRMFIQPLIENAEGDILRLDDVLGPWFGVVGFGADPGEHLSGAQRDYLTALGATFVKVVDSRAGRARRATVHPETQVVEDLEGHLREWFTRHSACFVVSRPDRYVAATAGRAGLGEVVDRLGGLLRPSGTATEKGES